MTTLYGIPNCDTVKKARAWLSQYGIDYVFHDFRKQGVPEPELDQWLAHVGWERLVNRKARPGASSTGPPVTRCPMPPAPAP